MNEHLFYDHGISAVDSGYVRPGLAAVHLIEEGGRVAIVDSGTHASAPRLLAALARRGLAPEAVDWLLLTHVHLDHAGGAGALMQMLPNARLVVHPRGVRHMIDPARLWAGTVEVYGEALARERYGELLPVPAGRIVEARDGDTVSLAGRTLEIMDVPGHARHHVAYFDPRAQGWFVGDAFGLSYRETHREGRAFVFPTTTPVQFEPQAMHASLERMLARAPRWLFLTHYGRVGEVPRLAADMHRLIDGCVAIAREAAALRGAEQQASIRAGLEVLLLREARQQGWAVQGAAAAELYAGDLDLNAQGLQVWLAHEGRAA
ncbi:MAG: MBL fold metallo-hydrolase [Candidatus Dactylopiibacterium sp.]|nr:MBL fold metallo-hydrolase [Candidatus Dactylopiibacterium sp.]